MKQKYRFMVFGPTDNIPHEKAPSLISQEKEPIDLPVVELTATSSFRTLLKIDFRYLRCKRDSDQLVNQ